MSRLNGLQAMPTWVDFFNDPQGATLGLFGVSRQVRPTCKEVSDAWYRLCQVSVASSSCYSPHTSQTTSADAMAQRLETSSSFSARCCKPFPQPPARDQCI
jgi:hypothetical protein